MKTSKLFKALFIAAAITTLIPAQATTGYLLFTGYNAEGRIGWIGHPFIDQSWTLEYEFTSTVADSDSDAYRGEFDSITGGHLSIGGVVRSLDLTSGPGHITLSTFPDNSYYNDQQSIQITAGESSVTFFASKNNSPIFPALFSNVNSLNSASFGTTVFAAIPGCYCANAYGGFSVVNNQYSDYIDVRSLERTSNYHVSVNTTSTFALPIPEPETYALMLVGLGVVGGIARRRTKFTKNHTGDLSSTTPC